MQVLGGVGEGSPSADKAYRPSLSVPGTSIWSCSTVPRCCRISPDAERLSVLVMHRNPARGERIGDELEMARSVSENVTDAVLVG